MKIYLICPVRNLTELQQTVCTAIVAGLENVGHTVHYPPRDVAQHDPNDPTGVDILNAHFEAMKDCDVVGVIWDVNSKGSHFDLGEAFALKKPLCLLHSFNPDAQGKSFEKVMKIWPFGVMSDATLVFQ